MLSLRASIAWIAVITLLVSGLPALGVAYYYYVKQQKGSDPQYTIAAIVQTCTQKEPLKTAYLAELLQLSHDQPKNLFQVNSHEARRVLLSSPLIRDAKVKKIPPGTLYVDYDLRQPVALLAECSNTAIDQEGVPIPVKPFFTPKKLPLVVLGLEESIPPWGVAVQGPKMQLALELLSILNVSHPVRSVTRIDVSKAFSQSYGQREIVVQFDNQSQVQNVLVQHPHLVRLSTDNYLQELANYYVLAERLNEEDLKDSFTNQPPVVAFNPIIINMRIPHLAFIKR